MRGLLCGVMALCVAGCKPTVARVEFPARSVDVRDRAGSPLPEPRCTAGDGEVLPLPADAVWTVEPASLATISNGRLVPRESGDGAIVLAVNGGRTKARVALSIQLVDSVRLRCADAACSVRLGQTTRVKATALTGNEPLAAVPLAWTSTQPQVARVDEEGVVTGVATGTADISAAAGGKTASVRVTVLPLPDEVVIICPRPAFSVAYKTPLGLRGTGSACVAGLEQPTRLLGQLRASGVVLPSSEIAWRSGNEQVAVVSGGVVKGLAKGTTFVEARLGELSVSMAINVLAQSADDLPTQCVAENGPQRTLELVSRSKTQFTATCPGPLAERCLRGLTRTRLEDDALYVVTDRCCCWMGGAVDTDGF